MPMLPFDEGDPLQDALGHFHRIHLIGEGLWEWREDTNPGVLWEANSLMGRWEMCSWRRGSCKTVMKPWPYIHLHMCKGPSPRARFQILDRHTPAIALIIQGRVTRRDSSGLHHQTTSAEPCFTPSPPSRRQIQCLQQGPVVPIRLGHPLPIVLLCRQHEHQERESRTTSHLTPLQSRRAARDRAWNGTGHTCAAADIGLVSSSAVWRNAPACAL
ncbi:hypothetical protein FIBSPDRAFT_250463 [Athelia psychrophila]|uniref:Uncharacterized protein n=1 Tax=Athelia psychrophila TaxID=1759441 RepID=A0A165XXH1_9AGAM|nr:hypothetical protein FIBSPDRAFT_250463 [Fibularhizoctonia sp. CBS 109695]